MIWWEILEESTRLANFLVGRLDTGTFSADSLQAIKAQDKREIKYVNRPVGLQFFLLLHGQYYDVDSSYHVPDAEGKWPVLWPLHLQKTARLFSGYLVTVTRGLKIGRGRAKCGKPWPSP